MVVLNSDGVATFVSASIFLFIAIIAVGLRMVSKRFTKARYGADDWWCLISLALYCGWIAAVLWGVLEGGGGANIGSLLFNYTTLVEYLKSLYIGLHLYLLTATAIKISILCFYRRIFSTPGFRRLSLVVGLTVTAFFIATYVAAVISCLPINHFWTPLGPGYCFNFNVYFLASTIAETFVDLAVLIMPIHMISTLQLPRKNKAFLYAIFLLGGFVIITGIVRIILVYNPHGNEVSFTKAELWTNIHLGVAIVCACLPTYRPLLAKASAFPRYLRECRTYLFGRGRTINGLEEGIGHPLDEYTTNSSSGYKELNEHSVRHVEVSNPTQFI